MAPALTKFVKDGHGIRLSSPPSQSEQSVMGIIDVDSQLRPSEDLQKMLLSVLPTLDSYLQATLLDLPSSTGQCRSLGLPNTDGSAKSYDKTLRKSHLAPLKLPGALDTRFLPEHNGHHSYKYVCRGRPGACDVHPLCSLSSASAHSANGDYSSLLETAAISNQENCWLDQLVSNVELQKRIKKRESRQAGLKIRAHNLQRRLETALGQHAVLHCDQQLDGLRTQGLDLGGFSADLELSPGDSELHFPWPDTHFTEIEEFGLCSRAVLRGLQDTLDSEATASSSSDEEPVETNAPREYRELCVASPCFEEMWFKERAEMGSRWSWLQLRVGELEGRIQQLEKLHKNIRSSKGCVVLADSQPMTTWRRKNALLKEVSALSCTALDADNEPCSPTRLLHNIERQSAQLSQIVNSLMPPLNLSPLSKLPQPRKDKGAFDSDVFVSGNSKRKMFGVRRRQLFKDDMSCVCARTRPLVIYHKPRLFRLNSACSNSSSKRLSTLSGFTNCSCSNCSSSDQGLGCFDPDSCCNGTLSSGTCTSNSGASQLSWFTKGSAREEWSQIPLALRLSPIHYRRHSSTPRYKSHKYKHYTHQHKKRLLGLSPIRGHSVERENRAQHKRRKRRRRNSCNEDENDALSCCEDSSDEMFEENFVLASQRQNTTRGGARRRHGESLFNIDNIIIPASLTKVEKLQYKDILTPSWHMLNVQSVLKDEANFEKHEEKEIEVLTDEVFAHRHLPFEQKEKMRWCFWGKRHSRHSLRSSSRINNVKELRPLGMDSSVEGSFTQLDTDEQLSSEECLPQAPWQRRMFPLNDDEEAALSSDVLQWCLDSTCTLSSSTSLNSDLITTQSTHATPPSGGHYMDCINSGS